MAAFSESFFSFQTPLLPAWQSLWDPRLSDVVTFKPHRETALHIWYLTCHARTKALFNNNELFLHDQTSTYSIAKAILIVTHSRPLIILNVLSLAVNIGIASKFWHIQVFRNSEASRDWHKHLGRNLLGYRVGTKARHRLKIDCFLIV